MMNVAVPRLVIRMLGVKTLLVPTRVPVKLVLQEMGELSAQVSIVINDSSRWQMMFVNYILTI